RGSLTIDRVYDSRLGRWFLNSLLEQQGRGFGQVRCDLLVVTLKRFLPLARLPCWYISGQIQLRSAAAVGNLARIRMHFGKMHLRGGEYAKFRDKWSHYELRLLRN
ncbi:hypothetical protein, partial [Rhodanobacter sp. OR444]|uniref:hypothetical protein n=1 Tax=Rhodanobacter sp. OR444 TaxID=1076525 RepID=UPI001C838D0C